MTEQEQRLFDQGIKDYADAVNAINAFRSLVQAMCRRAVENNLGAYKKALGIELGKIELQDYAPPGGLEFELGVRWRYSGTTDAEFGHTLFWGPDEKGGTETLIMIWVWARKKNLDRLREALRQKEVEHDTNDDDTVVWIADEITAADVDRIDSKLDAMTKKWINLWRRVGGVKALVGKTA